MDEKGPHTKLDKFGGGLHGRTYKLKETTWDGLNIKIPKQKWVMADSHILGL